MDLSKIKSKKISLVIYLLAFIVSLIYLIFMDEKHLSILGLDFCYSKMTGLMLCIANFILFLFKNNSKNLHEIPQISSLILLFLINCILLTDNIIAFLVLLFLLFLLIHCTNKRKERLISDCFLLFLVFVLLSYELIRYLILNDIPTTFLSIKEYGRTIYNLNLNLVLCAFLILISRLFNFFPFNIKTENNYMHSVSSVIFSVIGLNLFIKICPFFESHICNFQNIFALYLVLNTIYCTFTLFKTKNTVNLLHLGMSAGLATGIFNLFLYNDYGVASFIYYSIAIIISNSAGLLFSEILKNKFGSYEYTEYKKIGANNKLIKILIIITFLNIAKMPPFVYFFGFVNTFVNIFLISFSNGIEMSMPYILFACAFLMSLNSLYLIGKIISDPIDNVQSFKLHFRQIVSIALIYIPVFLAGILIKYMLEQILQLLK